MPANIETMFYVRETPWHGLGTRVEEALNSSEALELSGLDWNVIQEPIYTKQRTLIPSFMANIRESDGAVLGVITDRYRVVQNKDAFKFTDALLGEGVTYETAGSLQGGKKVWLLARMPEKYKILGDEITPYMVFSNSHDGSESIKVAMTPVRVVCNNTLNLALNTAKRVWSANHTVNINTKLNEATKTLLLAEYYMNSLNKTAEELAKIRMTDSKVISFIEELLPIQDNASKTHENNINILRNDLLMRYMEAPDLKCLPKDGWRFINAVSDFGTHVKPLRKTENYKENLFSKTIDGIVITDKAYEMVKSLV